MGVVKNKKVGVRMNIAKALLKGSLIGVASLGVAAGFATYKILKEEDIQLNEDTDLGEVASLVANKAKLKGLEVAISALDLASDACDNIGYFAAKVSNKAEYTSDSLDDALQSTILDDIYHGYTERPTSINRDDTEDDDEDDDEDECCCGHCGPRGDIFAESDVGTITEEVYPDKDKLTGAGHSIFHPGSPFIPKADPMKHPHPFHSDFPKMGSFQRAGSPFLKVDDDAIEGFGKAPDSFEAIANSVIRGKSASGKVAQKAEDISTDSTDESPDKILGKPVFASLDQARSYDRLLAYLGTYSSVTEYMLSLHHVDSWDYTKALMIYECTHSTSDKSKK